MRLPFTEKFLWNAYKVAKISVRILNRYCEGRYRGDLSGAEKMFEFLTFKDFSKLIKIEQKKSDKKRLGKLINNLQNSGYLCVKKVKNKKAIMITSKGAEKILKIKYKIEGRPKREDRRWQMVIFDIPEKIRKRRDYLRSGLKRLDYEKLQQSVWVCPFDVFKETKKLIGCFKLESFVNTFLVEEIVIK